MTEAFAFKAAENMTLGSATVPATPPVETSIIPSTLLALFRSMILNCSINSILPRSQLFISKV